MNESVAYGPDLPSEHELRLLGDLSGKKIALLVPCVEAIDWAMLEGVESIAISAGASAPEVLVEKVLDGFAARFEISVETLTTADETMFFPLPKRLRDAVPL